MRSFAGWFVGTIVCGACLLGCGVGPWQNEVSENADSEAAEASNSLVLEVRATGEIVTSEGRRLTLDELSSFLRTERAVEPEREILIRPEEEASFLLLLDVFRVARELDPEAGHGVRFVGPKWEGFEEGMTFPDPTMERLEVSSECGVMGIDIVDSAEQIYVQAGKVPRLVVDRTGLATFADFQAERWKCMVLRLSPEIPASTSEAVLKILVDAGMEQIYFLSPEPPSH